MTIAEPSPFSRLVPPVGRYQCAGACGAVVELPGVCSNCDAVGLRQAHADALKVARDTIPQRFRWAQLDEPILAKRVCPIALAAIHERRSRGVPMGLALVGPSGAGKTSLACAMLRAIHDGATWEAPHNVVERARRAWYVSAAELLETVKAWQGQWSKGDPPEILQRARAAAVLVLDNVDAGKPDDTIGRLLFARHDADRPTIVTTWMTREQAAACYGDGWARRAYAATVEVGDG